MNNTAAKHNKKEDRKKMMVRIVCIVMAVALVLTSGLAMISWIFQDDTNNGYLTAEELQAYIDAGIISVDENGNYIINITEDADTHVHEDGTVHSNESDEIVE